MKILYITDIYFCSKDATLVHVKEIINNLSEIKNEMFLIGTKSGEIKVKAKIKYLRSYHIRPLRGILFNLKLFFILPFYIYKNKIQVVYTRQSGTLIVPAIISKLFSIPYITEVNGNMEEEMIESKQPQIYCKICNLVERISYKIAKKIVVVTSELKEYLVKKYNLNPNKIEIIENGADSKFFKPLDKEKCKLKLNLNKNYKYLCYTGNFALWQGLETLIKSFEIVLKKYPNTKLLLVGDGEQKEDLIKLSKKNNISEKIIFTGRVEHELIPYYLCASEVCLAPFTAERNKRMGSSAFKTYEYASCGRPIITTHLDFVNKNKCGLVAKADNYQDLAKKIIYLLKNPKLAKQMGENGRRAILKSYSWKNVAERTQGAIKEII
jgi:glycosyltransferase involved in cell wall biosynthesis